MNRSAWKNDSNHAAANITEPHSGVEQLPLPAIPRRIFTAEQTLAKRWDGKKIREPRMARIFADTDNSLMLPTVIRVYSRDPRFS
jgi:hypothetical protein